MKNEKIFSLVDKDRLIRLLCLAISFVTALSVYNFVVTPIVSDLCVFLSGANQANYINKNLVIGSYKQWKLKGYLNRLMVYLLYKITTFISEYPSFHFGMVCSIVYLIMVFCIILLSVNLITDTHNRYKKLIFAELIFLSLVMTWAECHVQAEMSGTVILILAIALYYHVAKKGLVFSKRDVVKLLLAGVLIGAIFYFKSVMLLMSVSVVAGVCLLLGEKKALSMKRLCIVVLGSAMEISFNAILLVVINPGEFQDMLDTSLFQRPFWDSNATVISAVKTLVSSYAQYGILIPVLRIGIICLLLNIIYYVRVKNYLDILCDVILWLMPFLFIFLTNKYFVYHYLAFVFPCLMEAIILLKRKSRADKVIFCSLFAAVCLRYHIDMGVFTENIQNYIATDKKTYAYNKEFFDSEKIDRDDMCMYLDDGVGSYYMGNKSYLKYYFPLPLQRLNDKMDIKCRAETLERAMSYDGRYILVYEHWFFDLGYNDEIRKRINSEYRYIGSFKRYVPHQFISKDVGTQEYDLYEKIDIEI